MARMVKCIKLGREAEGLDRPNLADKKARDYLVQQMENHFFGSGADVASGFVPPSK